MGKTVISDDDRFEWDEKKDRINEAKHGFSFVEALRLFDDPYLLELYDDEHATVEEERYIGIGNLRGMLILAAGYTERGKRTRIYSARKATDKEERIYYEKVQEFNSGKNS